MASLSRCRTKQGSSAVVHAGIQPQVIPISHSIQHAWLGDACGYGPESGQQEGHRSKRREWGFCTGSACCCLPPDLRLLGQGPEIQLPGKLGVPQGLQALWGT
eukprot:1156856-Pelagomonas_calceolata.AAC.4